MKSLSMALTRLRQGTGDIVQADERRVWTTVASDVGELLAALDESRWQRASDLYMGAFLAGVVLPDWGSELEEWVYTTREYLAERVQHARLSLAEDAARKGAFAAAAELAEQAYRLPGLGGSDVAPLRRLYRLLTAGRSLLAPAVRKELSTPTLTMSNNDAWQTDRTVTSG